MVARPETWASRFLLVEHGAPFPVLALPDSTFAAEALNVGGG